MLRLGRRTRRKQERVGIEIMLAYPVILEEDAEYILATSPDFPELTTFGDDRDEALMRAVDAFEEAIAARIHDWRDIPKPSIGEPLVTFPALTTLKVTLYRSMREQGIGKAELARRLGWHISQVDRMLDLQHHSRLDHLDAALSAIGQKLQIGVVTAGS